MSQLLATALCLAGIVYLFWADRGRTKDVSPAVWIPFLWMLFAASRYPSQWWHLGTPVTVDAQAYMDGSPLDRNVFLLLILSGILVLSRRAISWSDLIRSNIPFLLFWALTALSISWADEPFVSFKRWIKDIGDITVALILLTEKRPLDALGVVLRRIAFILLPLSVLFIMYYPDLGRGYHLGTAMYTGVAWQKNSLGQLCMILAVYFAWFALLRRWAPDELTYRPPRSVVVIVILMLAWLLMMAQSATALGLTAGIGGLLAVSSLRYFAHRPRRLIVLGVLVGVLVPLLEYSIQLSDSIIRLLGREPDLTGRAPLWEAVMRAVPNAWVGAGYESFWTADRLRGIGIIQAHNGYIDLYANLGWIGISLFLIAILAGLMRARSQMNHAYAYAVLRFALIGMALIYNYTEAAFKPLNNIYILLLFSILAAPESVTTLTKSAPARRFDRSANQNALSRAQHGMLSRR